MTALPPPRPAIAPKMPIAPYALAHSSAPDARRLRGKQAVAWAGGIAREIRSVLGDETPQEIKAMILPVVRLKAGRRPS